MLPDDLLWHAGCCSWSRDHLITWSVARHMHFGTCASESWDIHLPVYSDMWNVLTHSRTDAHSPGTVGALSAITFLKNRMTTKSNFCNILRYLFFFRPVNSSDKRQASLQHSRSQCRAKFTCKNRPYPLREKDRTLVPKSHQAWWHVKIYGRISSAVLFVLGSNVRHLTIEEKVWILNTILNSFSSCRHQCCIEEVICILNEGYS